MKKTIAIILFLLISGCASMNETIIKQEHITAISNFPMRWSSPAPHYNTDFTLRRGEIIGDYTISGVARPTELLKPASYSELTFVFYCVKGQNVTHSFHMLARAETDGSVRIQKDFHTDQDFDGVSYRYAVRYRRD